MVLPTGWRGRRDIPKRGDPAPLACARPRIPQSHGHGNRNPNPHHSDLPSFLLTIYVVPFTTDGRRPVYLTVLPIFTLGSLGVALARTVPQLMLFRVVQAFGGGGGMSVGAGVISDIYRLEERGSAIGFFFAVSLF